MSSLTVQEAQAKLSELIHNLKPGDEVVITDTTSRWLDWSAPNSDSKPLGVLARFAAQ